MASFSLRTTTQGLQLLASTLNNQTVNFTTVVLGSGVSGSGTDMTGLVTPVLELPIVSLSKSKNKVALTAVLQYGAIETGFTWSEVGLYATNPNGGDDILVYYSSTDKPDYIPGKNETTLNNKMLQFTIAVVNADNITITVEGNTIFATAQQLESLRSEITETFEQISEGGGEYGNTVVTLTHAKNGTVHAFSGLGNRTGLVPCQFKSAAGYTEGDTATIDGTAYTITLTGADAPETDLFVSGKSILVDVDTEGKTINFKAGGGLTKAKLALADATEDTVFNGRTYYAGDKTLRTGRAQVITEEEYTAATATPDKVFNGYTYYAGDKTLKKGTFSGRAIVFGCIENAGAGLTTMGSKKTYTISYDNELGTPKFVVAYFDNHGATSMNFSPYAAAGRLGGTTAASISTGSAKNFLVAGTSSVASSTYTINSTGTTFVVSGADSLSTKDLYYIFIW